MLIRNLQDVLPWWTPTATFVQLSIATKRRLGIRSLGPMNTWVSNIQVLGNQLSQGAIQKTAWVYLSLSALGSSPGLAGGMVRFQPGHGDDSLCAWPHDVSGKKSGKERSFPCRCWEQASLQLHHPRMSDSPCQRLGHPSPSSPSPLAQPSLLGNEGTKVIWRAGRNLENCVIGQKLEC